MNVKEITKITLNLVIIYIIGGLLLAVVYAKTDPIIFQKAKAEKEAALKAMVPEAKSVPAEAGDWQPWEKDAKYYTVSVDNSVGAYVVESFSKGYSSYIDILVATDPNFVVKKIKIIDSAETPGLGDDINQPWFQKQFAGRDLDHLVVVKHETKDQIQAITGATISSRAVTNGVKDAVRVLQNKYNNKNLKYSWEAK